MDPAVVRRVDSIALDLLTGDSAALRRRIHGAGSQADLLRRHIQALAERRTAHGAGGRPLTVRLYAWPMLVSFESSRLFTALEPEVYAPRHPAHAPLADRLRRLWSNVFVGSGASQVLPLPRAVHLNAVIAGDPVVAHRCVFKGVSILEGRRPAQTRFSTPGPADQFVGGPVSAPYLMLAYVACPAELPDPLANMLPSDMLEIGQLLAAMMSLKGATPAVRVWAPVGFFKALDTLQLEQLRHFAQWCELRGLRPEIRAADQLTPEGRRRVVQAWHGDFEGFDAATYSWTFDADWRAADAQDEMLIQVQARPAPVLDDAACGAQESERSARQGTRRIRGRRHCNDD